MTEIINLQINPIVESVIEVRFKNLVKYDLMIGQMCDVLSINTIDELPILSLPASIRSTEPTFQYSPYHRIIFNDVLSLLVGPNVIAFSNTNKYLGWNSYSQTISDVISKISTRFMGPINRIGLRNINRIENCDISKITIDFTMNNQKANSIVRNMILALAKDEKIEKCGKLLSTIKIDFSNIDDGDDSAKYSMLDIDNKIQVEDSINSAELIGIIQLLHDTNKKHFFSFISKELLEQMQPVYGEKNDLS